MIYTPGNKYCHTGKILNFWKCPQPHLGFFRFVENSTFKCGSKSKHLRTCACYYAGAVNIPIGL